MSSTSVSPNGWRTLSGRITFKQWTLSSDTKEKGQSCGCSQSHSCGQGERRDERMPVGFAMESEWTKKLSQAFSLCGRPAAVAPFFLFFSCGESIETDRRWRRDLFCCFFLKKGKNCDGNKPREHAADHWKSLVRASSNYFWDIKEYTGKGACVTQQVLWDFFYINSRFGSVMQLVI